MFTHNCMSVPPVTVIDFSTVNSWSRISSWEPLLRLIIPAGASILTPFFLSVRISVATKTNAEVAELADAADSKSAGLNTRVGSTPTFGTKASRVSGNFYFIPMGTVLGTAAAKTKKGAHCERSYPDII